MNKYTVIYNKNSRGKNLNKTLLNDLFKDNNISCDLYEVTEKKETDEIIKNTIDNSVEYFTSVGGDGSLNYLVNSLLKNNHPNPVVSCLPAGSGSDFIRTFGISQKIDEAIIKSLELLNRDDFRKYNIIDLRISDKIIVE